MPLVPCIVDSVRFAPPVPPTPEEITRRLRGGAEPRRPPEGAKPRPPSPVETTIAEFAASLDKQRVHLTSPSRVLVLREVDADRCLAFTVGIPEADALALPLQDAAPPRPLTHDLTLRLLESAGAAVTAVAVDRVEDGTHLATISLTLPGGATSTIDSRPSDAIALALRAQAPILVAEQLLSGRTAIYQEMLADFLETTGAARSEPVRAAFRAVPRHLFLPDVDLRAVYEDRAHVTKRLDDGQPISSSSQPALMALMLDQLDLAPGMRVLEIGAGTGYNAALLAHIVGPTGHVVAVDLDQDIVDAARAHLAAAGAGVENAEVVCADGAHGHAAGAPYDRIMLTVSAWDIAPSWIEQLAPAGRLLVPLVIDQTHVSTVFVREGDHLISGAIVPCAFMLLRGALARPATEPAPSGRDLTHRIMGEQLRIRAYPKPANPPDQPDAIAVLDRPSVRLVIEAPHVPSPT